MSGALALRTGFGGSGGGGDPAFAYVESLVHFDGTQGSTTIVDVKGHTWTCLNQARLETTTPAPKWGTAAAILDGGNDNIVSTAIPAIGTQDFTAEAWVWNASAPSGFRWIAFNGATAGTWAMGFNGTNFIYYVNGTVLSAAYPGTLQWWHAALCRIGSTAKIFINGTESASGSDSTNLTSSGLRLGGQLAIEGLVGSLDDWRLTIGLGRYPGTFTSPTAAFPDS